MKRTTLTLLFALVAIALVLSLWWWQRGDDTVPLPVEQPPIASEATPTAAAPASTSAQAPERSAAVDATAPPPKAAATATFDILVVDAETQQPVADAEACWSDAATQQQANQLPAVESQELWRDPERMAWQLGQRGRSDRDGRLRVVVDRSGCRVFARTTDRYGELFVGGEAPPPAGGYRLLLVLEEAVTVRVLDAAGRPAEAVPVGCRVRAKGDTERPDLRSKQALTDAAGLATVAHLQQHRTVQWGPHQGEPIHAFVVGIALPGMSVPPVELAAAAPLPNDPIELRLPPTGSLRIRYSLAGKFCDGIDGVLVHAGSADAPEDQNQAVYAPVDTDGWATFRWLPAGVPLFAEPFGRIVSMFAAAAIPPVAVGAVRQCEVDLAGMAIGVRARVLDPAGAPLANASLLGWFGVDGSYGSLGVRTDAQGVFLHFLPNSRDKTTIQLQRLELAVVDRPDLRLQVPPRELQLGVNELGDLRVGGEPLVCGGRLDGYVAGQQGVQLTIERERIDASAGAGAWRVVDGLRVGVGADGVFAARGEIGAGRYRLVVTSRDYLPVPPIEFRAGQDDLVVPLRTGARLEVACLVPPRTDCNQLQLDLVGGPPRSFVAAELGWFHSPADNRRGFLIPSFGTTTTCRWTAVEPGTYTLRVSLLAIEEPLLEVPDVVLPPPADGDPRLASLDLRAVLRTVALRLLDANGQPLPVEGAVFPQPQKSAERWIGSLLDERSAVVPLPMRAQQLLVVNRGFRPVSVLVTPETTSLEVRCEPWPSVALSLATGSPLPAGCEVLVELVGATRRYGRYEASHASQHRAEDLHAVLHPEESMVTLRSGGEPVVVFVSEGASALAVSLRRGDRRQKLQRFTPGEVVAGAPVTITLDAEELAAAAAALAAPAKAK